MLGAGGLAIKEASLMEELGEDFGWRTSDFGVGFDTLHCMLCTVHCALCTVHCQCCGPPFSPGSVFQSEQREEGAAQSCWQESALGARRA